MENLEMTDEEIIVLCQNGDDEAFKNLIDRYASLLFNFVARLTNRNDAPDIVQEVFIKAWKNMKRFDERKASFKTWIFAIGRNTAIDFLRKKKSVLFSEIENKNSDDNDSFAENIPDEQILPDIALQKLQDQELLNDILKKLSLEENEVLVLHYQEEMTFEEIGKILDKSLNTVKSKHRRALIKLRKMIG
ncbi:MAG: sigma-70 family RNA polymerase sigma factor [Candidatus Nomurabacteria bacterium]|nr:sigma-70 family RNA polymerase sigma factor [Candidatus Nomurabacteria bacterium]